MLDNLASLRTLTAATLAALMLGCAQTPAPNPAARSAMSRDPTFDIVIAGGTILDGGGGPRYVADVGVADGAIVRIGDLSRASAKRTIDARGLFVAPGFINIHDHPTPAGLARAENMLLQGVATSIFNADGSSHVSNPGGPSLDRDFAALARNGLAINIAGDAGFNSVWIAVMGTKPGRATPDQIRQMQGMLVDNLKAGAAGVSAGLDYKPAYFAHIDDVAAVVSAARNWRTHFCNHDRLTPESGFSSLAGAAETIEIGKKAGIVPEITHMKVQGWQKGRSAELLAMMKTATDAGHFTAADVYPYIAGQTGLGALIIPGWAQEVGIATPYFALIDSALSPPEEAASRAGECSISKGNISSTSSSRAAKARISCLYSTCAASWRTRLRRALARCGRPVAFFSGLRTEVAKTSKPRIER